MVPIYQTESKGRVRYTLSFYRDGRRERKVFNTLEDTKREALFVAQRIQVGMQHVTDLKPHERDSFKAAEAMLQKSGIPLVAAVEDYLRARDLAGTESLAAMASEYGQHFKKVDENLTRDADSRIPGNCVILSGFKSKRNSRQNFSKFHTDSTQTARKQREVVQGRVKPRTQISL